MVYCSIPAKKFINRGFLAGHQAVGLLSEEVEYPRQSLPVEFQPFWPYVPAGDGFYPSVDPADCGSAERYLADYRQQHPVCPFPCRYDDHSAHYVADE